MLYSPDVNEFVVKNLSEIKAVVKSISFSKDPYALEEETQEVIAKILSENAVKKFDPQYKGYDNRTSSISTYIYSLARNTIIQNSRKNSKIKSVPMGWDSSSNSKMEEDDNLIFHKMDGDYKVINDYNWIADQIKFDFEDFENFLKKNAKLNKIWKLSRSLWAKKNPDKKPREFSVLALFYALKLGYSRKEIADIFSVTPRLVSHTVVLLRKAFLKYYVRSDSSPFSIEDIGY